MTILAIGVIILSVLAVIFWFVFFSLTYAWTAGSPDDPKFFKPAFFTTWVHFFNYFTLALMMVCAIVALIYFYFYFKQLGVL